ncbi:unnamed protein product [Diamesa hyperborea]
MAQILNILFIAIIILNKRLLLYAADLKSSLNMQILNSGFHREINYSLKFAPVLNCELLLVQDVPSSVYIDNDQLLNLNKLNKLESYVDTYVDVELPTNKASAFKVYIFENVKKYVNKTLPVHFRYHSPSEKQFNRVEIESPKIYVSNCKVQEGNVVLLPCRNSSEILDFLELASASLCEWTELELTSAPITLSFLIPVGNIKSFNYVLTITILVSWLGCLLLTYVIIKKSRQISKKLL